MNIDWSDEIPSDPVAIHATKSGVDAVVLNALLKIAKPDDPKSPGNKLVKRFWGTDRVSYHRPGGIRRSRRNRGPPLSGSGGPAAQGVSNGPAAAAHQPRCLATGALERSGDSRNDDPEVGAQWPPAKEEEAAMPVIVNLPFTRTIRDPAPRDSLLSHRRGHHRRRSADQEGLVRYAREGRLRR